MSLPNLVDSHAHIVDPARFPYFAGKGYKPRPDETGDADSFFGVLKANGISHGLLVQPSCYGFDNSAMIDTITRAGGRLRGIAVVAPTISGEEMLVMKESGIVGVRLNLGSFDPDFLDGPEAAPFMRRITEIGWFLEVYAVGPTWAKVAPTLIDSGARLIIDHFGHPDLDAGLAQPGLEAVLMLARETDAAVKLSAAFRVSGRPFPHDDIDPFVASVVEAFGVTRCIWGSDWPFLNTWQRVTYEQQLSMLGRYLPAQSDRDQVLHHNPFRLFGFSACDAEAEV